MRAIVCKIAQKEKKRRILTLWEHPMDKRTVDELSIEELERILMLKKREARAKQWRRLAAEGRVIQQPEHHSLTGEEEALKGPFSPVKLEPFGAKPPSKAKRKRDWARIREGVLLTLEIGALLALIVVLILSFANLRFLNREAAQALEMSTPTPTPVIDVTILPGRPAPPSGDVPASYRDLIRPMPPIPIPTPAPGAPTRIVIPAIGVDAPVVEGDGWEELKRGVGHHIGSANPGEKGNMVLSGHNDIFGEVFRDLEKLDLGDEIIVYSGDVPYKYVVKAKRIVDPTDISIMAPTGKPIVTLITCYPYMIDTHRLVIVGELAQ